MKMVKQILTSVAVSVLSAVMLFGSTTTVFAVENDTFIDSEQSWMDDRFTEELKEKIKNMSWRDTLFVEYDIDPKAFSQSVITIEEFAKLVGREDEVIYSEEDNTYYAPEDLIEHYYKNSHKAIMQYANHIASKLGMFSETLVCYDFLNFKAYLYATEWDIFEFSELENDYSHCYYASKFDLADPVYYDEEHGITWDEYTKIIDLNLEYLKERDNYENYFSWSFYPYISYDFIEGSCLTVLSSYTNYDELSFMRVDDKYVCFDREYGGAYLFYDDGVVKNPAQMYDEGKITLDDYYKLGALLGDVNYDKKVDINDVTYLQMHLAGYVHSYEEDGHIYEYPYINCENQSNVMVADINNDSKNDVTDVTNLQMILAGYEIDFE